MAEKIPFCCAGCGHKMMVPAAYVGRRGECPKCGHVERIAAAPIEAPPPLKLTPEVTSTRGPAKPSWQQPWVFAVAVVACAVLVFIFLGRDRGTVKVPHLEQTDTQGARAELKKGIAFRKNEDFKTAESCCTEAIRLKPDYVEAYLERGYVYLQLSNYDKAIADYTEALRLKPGNADAYFCRGLAYHAKKEYDKAIADYTAAIRLKPDYADAYYNRGRADHHADDDKAFVDYTEAIRLKPDSADAYFFRGLLHLTALDYDKAIAEYTEAIGIEPEFGAAYHNRGGAYRKKGDKAKAAADFAKAQELGVWSWLGDHVPPLRQPTP